VIVEKIEGLHQYLMTSLYFFLNDCFNIAGNIFIF